MSRKDEDEVETEAFKVDLHVPNQELQDDERRQAVEWLEQLARQLAKHDGKKLAIQVTGLFDENGGYPDEESGDQPASPCAARTAEVSIMLCPGRRPYA